MEEHHMTIREKAAYLKGLVEGQGMDPEAGEGKLWRVLAEVIGDMAVKLDELEAGQEDLSETVDAVKDDLELLEDIVAGNFDDDDDDFDDSDDEDSSRPYYPFSNAYRDWDDDSGEGDRLDGDEEDDEDDFEMTYQVECPNCGEEIVFDDETLDEGSIYCPSCGAVLEFEVTSLTPDADEDYEDDNAENRGVNKGEDSSPEPTAD